MLCALQNCCQPVIEGKRTATASAEEVLRARFTAFIKDNRPYGAHESINFSDRQVIGLNSP